MFKGSIVALITPMKDGNLDMGAFEKLVERQVSEGSNGIVVCGSTGESFLLSLDEQKQLLSSAVQVTAGRIPVIAGIGGFSTEGTLALCHQAQDCMVDALMVVTPPYIKPTQESLYHYYETIHAETNVPIIVYNNPSRAGGIFVADDTLCGMAERLPRIVGVKDSTGCLLRPLSLRHRLPETFSILSGEDATTAAFLAQGGSGSISVIANIAPRLCSDLHKAWENHDIHSFARIRDALLPLVQSLFLEPNPVAVKYAASLMGLCENELRRPLLPLDARFQDNVRTTLLQTNLIKTDSGNDHGEK